MFWNICWILCDKPWKFGERFRETVLTKTKYIYTNAVSTHISPKYCKINVMSVDELKPAFFLLSRSDGPSYTDVKITPSDRPSISASILTILL
jgi:hypothetical protein